MGLACAGEHRKGTKLRQWSLPTEHQAALGHGCGALGPLAYLGQDGGGLEGASPPSLQALLVLFLRPLTYSVSICRAVSESKGPRLPREAELLLICKGRGEEQTAPGQKLLRTSGLLRSPELREGSRVAFGAGIVLSNLTCRGSDQAGDGAGQAQPLTADC